MTSYLISITAILFLVSCGEERKPVIYRTIKFDGSNCYMLDDIGGQVIEKQFEEGKIANYKLVGMEGYKIPLQSSVAVKDSITGEDFSGTWSYDESTGNISVEMTKDVTVIASSEVDPSFVTEEEFNSICSFEGVQYVQSIEEREASGEIYDVTQELSPTVYHFVMSRNGCYEERYVKKNDDDTYETATRNSIEEVFRFGKASEIDFVTPQSGEFSLEVIICGVFELTYNDFAYNESKRAYTSISSSQDDTTLKLKFNNKKVTNFYIENSQQPAFPDRSSKFTYNEKTPDYPERP